MTPILRACLLALLLPSLASAQALLTGQSNACYLSPYLPPGSHALACQPGAPIDYWDRAVPGTMALATDALLQILDPQVLVVWQGESWSSNYQAKLLQTLSNLAIRPDGTMRPIMLIEVAKSSERPEVTAVHRWLATHPMVAFIPTADLAREGTSDHFTPAAYATVAQRLIACYAAQCWQ